MNEKISPWGASIEKQSTQSAESGTDHERVMVDKIFSELTTKINDYLRTHQLHEEGGSETEAYFFSLTEPNENAATFIDEMVQYANDLLENKQIPYAFSVQQHQYDPENIRVAIIKL